MAASVLIWVLNTPSLEGGLHYITGGQERSILRVVGKGWRFCSPAGFGTWQAAVATLLGLRPRKRWWAFSAPQLYGGRGRLPWNWWRRGAFSGLAVIGRKAWRQPLAAFSFPILQPQCPALYGRHPDGDEQSRVGPRVIGYMSVSSMESGRVVHRLAAMGKRLRLGHRSRGLDGAGVALYLLLRKNKYWVRTRPACP